MTLDTYSIAEAVSILEKRRGNVTPMPASKSKVFSNGTSGEASLKHPVDIVAIVSAQGALTLQSPSIIAKSSMPRVDIYIVDPSAPTNIPVKVSLHGSSQLVRVQEEHIIPGDILRFNGVVLGNQHQAQGVKRQRDSMIHFQLSRIDPEPGREWYKVGRCIRDGASTVQTPLSLKETRRDLNHLPSEMATRKERIKELMDWFSLTSRTDTKLISGLSPLPCRQRTLDEIESAGLMSNIQVCVAKFDTHFATQASSQSRRRKRGLGRAVAVPVQAQEIGFVTLTDKRGSTMTLIDQSNRFKKTFRTALAQRSLLSLTYIQSKKQNDIDGRPLTSEDLVLWPTRKTSVSILSTQENKAYIEDYSHGDKMRLVTSQPSQTQPTQYHLAFHKHTDSGSDTYVSMESSIIEISVNGKNLGKHLHTWTIQQFQASMMETSGKNFASATILLKGLNVNTEPTDVLLAFAEGIIVQSICCGIPLSEWKTKCTGSLKRNGNSPKKRTWTIGSNILSFFKALLDEKIPLKWTVDMEKKPPQIVRVTLPKI